MRKENGPWRSPLDDYNPQTTEEMRAYLGPELSVPPPEVLTGEANFAWRNWYNQDRSLYIFNIILKECPDMYFQAQVLTSHKGYTYELFCIGPKDGYIPEDLVEAIIRQGIMPYIADSHAKMN